MVDEDEDDDMDDSQFEEQYIRDELAQLSEPNESDEDHYDDEEQPIVYEGVEVSDDQANQPIE